MSADLPERPGFRLFDGPNEPAWRTPQLGALGALLAFWSLPRRSPALISLPTGTGKTAIGVAARHVLRPRRTLVVVPSTALRQQTADIYSSEEVLRAISALDSETRPTVRQVRGQIDDWKDLEQDDVVIAIPASISPAHYEQNLPPKDLFDLIVVDEAHHSPARTWLAILEHFEAAKRILLTATPTRRDGKRVPGELIYHFPLRQALDEGIFKSVEPRILEIGPQEERVDIDSRLADETIRVLDEAAHSSSAALVRGSSVSRVRELAVLYESTSMPGVRGEFKSMKTMNALSLESCSSASRSRRETSPRAAVVSSYSPG